MAVKLRSIYYTQTRRYGQETFSSATLFPESFLSPVCSKSEEGLRGRQQVTRPCDSSNYLSNDSSNAKLLAVWSSACDTPDFAWTI